MWPRPPRRPTSRAALARSTSPAKARARRTEPSTTTEHLRLAAPARGNRSGQEAQPRRGARQGKHAVHLGWAGRNHEAEATSARALVHPQDHPEPGAVDELEPSQVEENLLRIGCAHALQLALERRAGRHIELTVGLDHVGRPLALAPEPEQLVDDFACGRHRSLSCSSGAGYAWSAPPCRIASTAAPTVVWMSTTEPRSTSDTTRSISPPCATTTASRSRRTPRFSATSKSRWTPALSR